MPNKVPAIGEKGSPTQLGTSATLIYQPVGARDAVVIINEGKDIAYIGQSNVTSTSGLPLIPGDKIALNRVPFAVYGVGSGSHAPFVTVVPSVF